jgi:hypothetical protein
MLNRACVTACLLVPLCLFSVSLVAQEAPPVAANVVSQGTVFLIQLSDRIDTRTVKAGDHFSARLAEWLVAGNGMTIDAGRKIKGHVSAVEPGLRTRVILSFEEIDTARGWVPLIATVTGVPGEHGLRQIGEEGEIGRQGMTREQIAEAIVVGAGKGAVEGERSGGKRGAATGAGSGVPLQPATSHPSAALTDNAAVFFFMRAPSRTRMGATLARSAIRAQLSVTLNSIGRERPGERIGASLTNQHAGDLVCTT